MTDTIRGAELLVSLLGGPDAIGRPFDLRKLPPSMVEPEEKFETTSHTLHNDGGHTAFAARLMPVIEERHAHITHFGPFVGIDDYLSVRGSRGTTVHYRLRVGINKPPELTAKFELEQGHAFRGEVTLDVSGNDIKQIRAMLALMRQLAAYSQQFAVMQSGMLWFVHDPEFGLLEVVSYVVSGIHPKRHPRSFVEVESHDHDVERGMRGVKAYAAQLGLTQPCSESVADMFGLRDSME